MVIDAQLAPSSLSRLPRRVVPRNAATIRAALGCAWALMPARIHEVPDVVRIILRDALAPSRDLPDAPAALRGRLQPRTARACEVA